MVVRNFLISLLLLTTSWNLTIGQNNYFVGLDIGPKVDFYRLASSGGQPFDNSIEISNPMAASFGVVGGAWMEEGYIIETGFYKADYRVNITLFNEKGDAYFVNTPINTFTSYMIPFNFNRVKTWQGKYEPRYFIFGTGFTVLAFTNLGLDETYYSPEIPVNPDNLTEGYVSYAITDNNFNAKVLMLNLNLGYQYPINESVNISVNLNPKLGIGGDNYFDITHRTPNHVGIRNTVFTSGNSVQVNIGFRYTLDSGSDAVN